MFLSVHDNRARVSFINKQAFHCTNNTVSDYFHLKTDSLFEETKSGKALAQINLVMHTVLCVGGSKQKECFIYHKVASVLYEKAR